MEYLGIWVTRTWIQPINKKVEAIVNMTPPNNTKVVRALIGIVNYYRDMCSIRSHLLHPLTALTSNKVKFKWTDMEQRAFNYIKRSVHQYILLSYLDFNKRFYIHTDTSNFNLVEVIIQYGKPIAFCSRKPTGPQTRYTVTEKELFSIVKTLKEFRTILLGQEFKIYTDHKNITCKKLIPIVYYGGDLYEKNTARRLVISQERKI